jgi:hypothetical protein
MTPDEKSIAYNAGFVAGKKHDNPSNQTMDFIIKTEKTMTEFREDIKTIKESIAKMPTIEGMELALERGITKALECCDKKYASKLSEKITYGLVGTILTSVLIAILSQVIK